MTRSHQKKNETSPQDPVPSNTPSSPIPEPTQILPATPKPSAAPSVAVSPAQTRAYSHLLDSDKVNSDAYILSSHNNNSFHMSIEIPDPDSDSDSSSVSSNSSPVRMSAKPTGSWTNNSPGKAPTVHARFLRPQEYGNVKTSFLRYLHKAKISNANSEEARDFFMACFQNEQTMNYFHATHDSLIKLDGPAFENAMLEHLVGTTWLKTVRLLILDACQDSFDDGAFSVMYESLVSYNNLLKSVGKQIDDSLFQASMRSALNSDFEVFLESEGVDLTTKDLTAWVTLLKEKDAHFRKYQRPELARLARLEELEKKRIGDSNSRRSANTPLSNILNTAPSSSRSNSYSSSANNNNNPHRFPRLSELDPKQRDFYNLLEMCFKCRTLFAGHHVNACNIPTPVLEVPFRPLDDSNVAYAKKFHDKYKRPITYNAIIKRVRSAPAIAAVAPAPPPLAVDDLDAFVEKSSLASNIAAVWGDIPVSSMQSDSELYSSRSRLRSPAPITGRRRRSNSSDLGDYHRDPSPMARSPRRRCTGSSGSFVAVPVAAVIDDLDDCSPSDGEVDYMDENGPYTPTRDHHPADSHHTVSDCCPPLRSPHFLFSALVEGPNVEFPLPMELLLDNGSHLILIRDDLVQRLGLKRYRLRKPEPISLATDSSSSARTILTEFVKLRVSDQTNTWTSRPFVAIITPSLCSPLILGMPFLSHNNLVSDYACRSVIHKPTSFDLLNPSPIELPDSRSPKQHRLDICKARIDVISELMLERVSRPNPVQS
ncbi:hypothetical protein K435DRAFT_858433 [Dendrothele bispora CBS 962.96]|uniref:Uncharacterized protein n=1 Tax=Dendrothele bispora (strain CBS 962.96) TaxID=1314807 RepID=A0A4S8M340_DENBC|nr:hypothetical protein K435DRAFT_858433 [Dendrothele bispora CBS 962.96]